jgi:hypothetical protein
MTTERHVAETFLPPPFGVVGTAVAVAVAVAVAQRVAARHGFGSWLNW